MSSIKVSKKNKHVQFFYILLPIIMSLVIIFSRPIKNVKYNYYIKKQIPTPIIYDIEKNIILTEGIHKKLNNSKYSESSKKHFRKTLNEKNNDILYSIQKLNSLSKHEKVQEFYYNYFSEYHTTKNTENQNFKIYSNIISNISFNPLFSQKLNIPTNILIDILNQNISHNKFNDVRLLESKFTIQILNNLNQEKDRIIYLNFLDNYSKQYVFTTNTIPIPYDFHRMITKDSILIEEYLPESKITQKLATDLLKESIDKTTGTKNEILNASIILELILLKDSDITQSFFKEYIDKHIINQSNNINRLSDKLNAEIIDYIDDNSLLNKNINKEDILTFINSIFQGKENNNKSSAELLQKKLKLINKYSHSLNNDELNDFYISKISDLSLDKIEPRPDLILCRELANYTDTNPNLNPDLEKHILNQLYSDSKKNMKLNFKSIFKTIESLNLNINFQNLENNIIKIEDNQASIEKDLKSKINSISTSITNLEGNEQKKSQDINIEKSKLSKLDSNLKEKQNQVKENQESIKKIQEFINIDYFNMDFFVIGLIESTRFGYLYEIAYVDYMYGQAIPTNDRALLETTTSYSKSGLSNDDVSFVETRKIKIKDELGGFYQNWNYYYTEQVHLNEYGSAINASIECQLEIESLNEEIKEIHQNIELVQSDINKLNKKIEQISKEQKDLSNKISDIKSNIDKSYLNAHEEKLLAIKKEIQTKK